MEYQRLALQDFSKSLSQTTELSSVALGGKIISVSDDFFAEAFHLLLVEPAPSLKGLFGPKGALFSGWESRRHNPAYDWCIIKLGTPGTIVGFDIDTTYFDGNEAPQSSVEILYASEDPLPTDSNWTEVLPRVDLGPSSRHLFTISGTSKANYVKLNMFPDGGIARFRVYGFVVPAHPLDRSELFDLAHVFAGGHVEATSDQHFGVGSNLILPGRGKDMVDGWETKRSRGKGHKDWVIIKLGAPGYLEHVEVDTAHFKGNFPESCELHATSAASTSFAEDPTQWTLILPRTKLGPHRQHYFQLENTHGVTFTHVRCTIYPDGGIKRIRVIGKRAEDETGTEVGVGELASVAGSGVREEKQDSRSGVKAPKLTTIPALPLTPEAFAPFGQVLQAYEDQAAAPRGTKITSANAGTAIKFHKLALLSSSYPREEGSRATSGISMYRCEPTPLEEGGTVRVKALERHAFTNQAFVPLGGGDPGKRYLVVVAKNGEGGKPDMRSLRAFIASGAQGIVYDTAVWHQPMTVLDKSMDLACVETQIGDGDSRDCEVLEVDQQETNYAIVVPRN